MSDVPTSSYISDTVIHTVTADPSSPRLDPHGYSSNQSLSVHSSMHAATIRDPWVQVRRFSANPDVNELRIPTVWSRSHDLVSF